MKKAIANVTVKINRVIYQMGTVFTAPYPPGVQREIDAGTGTVTEIVSDPALPVNPSVETPPPSTSLQPNNVETSDDDDLLNEYGEDLYAESEPEQVPEIVTAAVPPPEEVVFEKTQDVQETDADKKLRLISEAEEKFGVKIDKRKGLATVMSIVQELRDKADAKDNQASDLNEI